MTKSLICWLLLMAGISINGACQGVVSSGVFSGVVCCRPPAPKLHQGDSATAHLAKHHEFYGNAVIAQLGYIDTNRATQKEVWDNLELGLKVIPAINYEIERYSISFGPKGEDIRGPINFRGNKIHDSAIKLLRINYDLEPGSLLQFENIRARRAGSDHTVPLKDIKIRVY